MKRNIVIPFRNTCGTNELKMCIKLIEKNMQDLYNKIYILGDECFIDNPLVENVVIEEQKYNKWIDSNFLVQYYICYIDKEPFILFNDDFELQSNVLMDEIFRLHQLYTNNKVILDDSIMSAFAQFEKNNPVLSPQDFKEKFIFMLKEQIEILKQKCIREGIQI